MPHAGDKLNPIFEIEKINGNGKKQNGEYRELGDASLVEVGHAPLILRLRGPSLQEQLKIQSAVCGEREPRHKKHDDREGKRIFVRLARVADAINEECYDEIDNIVENHVSYSVTL